MFLHYQKSEQMVKESKIHSVILIIQHIYKEMYQIFTTKGNSVYIMLSITVPIKVCYLSILSVFSCNNLITVKLQLTREKNIPSCASEV